MSTDTLTLPRPAAAPQTRQPAAPRPFDTLVRDAAGLDDSLIEPGGPGRWIGPLFRMSTLGLAAHGAVLGAVAIAAGRADWTALGLYPAVLVAGLTLTLAVCLPSFYFYTQMAGVDASFGFVTAQALRVQSRTAVLLLGALPVYVALALARQLGFGWTLADVLTLGWMLPFLLGVTSVISLFRSFRRLSDRLPQTRPRARQLLLLMVLAWGAVYTVVAPMALWWVGRGLSVWR